MLVLILLIVNVCLILWILRLKAELSEVYRPEVFKNHEQKIIKPDEQTEEFTLGMNALTSEFTGKIQLDPLTNLPGREAFEARLLQAIHQSSRFEKAFAIMFLDIDDFKHVNKTKSHDIADKILIEAAKRLQKALRQIDTLTRFAGDKFIVLLPQLLSPETAAYVAQRLIDAIALPFTMDDQKVLLTASVGVAIFPTDGRDEKALLTNVTDALHQAKTQGKNRYQFYRQEMHALGKRELSMNAAFSSDDYMNKIQLFYQPQIDINTGKMICIHASPVLILPEYPNISFQEFAQTATNCKRIFDIGVWELREALAQYQKWQQEDFKLEHLIVDVTYDQIQNSKFIAKIDEVLKEFNINNKEIVFEIVEKDLMDNIDKLERAFSMLNKMNIQIGISVFALGRLVLHKVTQLPVNFLKIDAKLLTESKDTEEQKGILHTMMLLASEMKINVVAENIDNEQQKEMLQKLGCNVMQGKLFGEPLPADVVKNK